MATKEPKRHLILVVHHETVDFIAFYTLCYLFWAGNNISSICLRDLFLVIMGEVLYVSKPNSAAAAGIGHFLWHFCGFKTERRGPF